MAFMCIVGKIGVRMSLLISSTGDIVYAGNLYLNSKNGTQWFLMFGSILSGITDSLMYAVEGPIITCLYTSAPPTNCTNQNAPQHTPSPHGAAACSPYGSPCAHCSSCSTLVTMATQTTLFWIIGQIIVLSYMTGTLRGVECVGQAVAYGIKSSDTMDWLSIGLNVGLFVLAIPFAWAVIRKIGVESFKNIESDVASTNEKSDTPDSKEEWA
ncbi:hypothetical protein PLEOSDRAFT_154577 [Pleurotus ostreatus PC15]|uniref:Uncharacterized protein n=1 Tax=Pleurotus ostreatus (strain PC15) TaxID=1137138 RepID=A0A067P7K7_PLEO1|nr:hypothetical protein PLEOSDRAFT_154577 [Pleurotus ostreatus PC15]